MEAAKASTLAINGMECALIGSIFLNPLPRRNCTGETDCKKERKTLLVGRAPICNTAVGLNV